MPEVGTGAVTESNLAVPAVVPARSVTLPALSKVRSPDWYVKPVGGVMVPASDAVSVVGLKANK